MKKMKRISISAILILIAACSSDDNSNTSTPEESGAFSPDVTKVSIANNSGEVPLKGEAVSITVTVTNSGSEGGMAEIAPKITSNRFEDFTNVSTTPVEISLDAGETAEVDIEIGPFVQDTASEKLYAMNRGEYVVETVTLNSSDDTSFEGGTFSIETSNKILVPVLYDPAYLEKLMYTEDIERFLELAFTRRVEISDNATFTVFEGGVDEMMDIEHLFYPIATSNVSDYDLDSGVCEKSAALAGEELGLTNGWVGPNIGTQTQNHGFDYLISLTPNSIGGITCGALGVQVSGTRDADLTIDRAHFTMAHQTGHIYGAVHCDQSLNFVMCGGNRNPKYINDGTLVFDINSRNMMQNIFE